MRNISIKADRKTSLIAIVVVASIVAVAAAFLFAVSNNIYIAGASSSPSNVQASLSVKSTCLVGAPSNTVIVFGTGNQVTPTQTLSATNAVTFTDSGGNAAANILVAGANWISGSNNFYAVNTLWSATSGGTTTALALWSGSTASLVDTLIQIPQPTRSAPTQSNTIYFGLTIPAGTPAGVFTQNIVTATQCIGGSLSSTTNIVGVANVQSACFISLSNTLIDFGSLNPNSNIATANDVTVTNAGGNIAANILVDGGNWIQSATANFYVTNTLWDSTLDATYIGNAVQLLPNLQDTNIQIAAGSIASPNPAANIYFGVGVPAGQGSGAYTQNIILETKC